MTYTINLTEGNIKNQLISLTIPLIIGNILQQLYNTIDALVIVRYVGQTAFAAIGVAGTIMNLFIFVLSGFCAGISIIFAQFYGNNDLKGFRKEGFLSAFFGGAFTILLSILAVLMLNWLLIIIQTPDEVATFAHTYLNIIFCGFLATFFYNLCSAALRAIGNTRVALIVLIIAMLTNLILDLLFVAVFHMGIAGAAWATVAAQLLSVVLCLIYIRKRLPLLLFSRCDMRYDGILLKRTVIYGAVSALHQSSLYIGKLLVQGAVNSMGTAMILAYTATTKIEGFANSFGDSGAAAISVFVAQNNGCENKKRALYGFHTGLVMLIILGATLSLIMYVSSSACVALMIGDASSIEIANGANYLKLISLFYTFCFIGNAFVGFYRGSGRINIPVVGTVIHISIRVILSYTLVHSMGLSAVAIATGIGWITVVTFQYIIYKR